MEKNKNIIEHLNDFGKGLIVTKSMLLVLLILRIETKNL